MNGAATSAWAVSRDGIPLRYQTLGGDSPALVFVHGWSCDLSYWRHQVGLADRHRVVMLDLAGHGGSGSGRREWAIESYGEDVAAVVEHLGLDDSVLIGHSMGGDVIVEAALRLPGRVRGLVWVDSYHTLGGPRSPREAAAEVRPFLIDFVSATRALVAGLFLPDSDPELVEWVAQDMAAAPPDVAIGTMRHIVTYDAALLSALGRLRLPIVAINSNRRPSDVEALNRHGVAVVGMPGVGHFPMLENPPAFERVLDRILEESMTGAQTTSPTIPGEGTRTSRPGD